MTADPHADTSIGPPASDETVVVPNSHADDETQLAWSTEVFDYPATPKPWRTVLLAGAAIISTGAAIALGITALTTNQQTSSSTSTTIYASTPAPSEEPKTVDPLPNSFSGRYIRTSTNSSGHEFTNVWNVTPCGYGCVTIKVDGFPTVVRASLIDGNWVLDFLTAAICADGSTVPDAGNGHTELNAVTLRGSSRVIWFKPACGNPSTSDPDAHTVVLTRAD